VNVHPAPPAPPAASGIAWWIWVALVASALLIAWGLALTSRR
jgi:hypothetical protein